MNILESITSLVDWLQTKFKDKAGTFMLGILVGTVPAITVIYLFEDRILEKETIIKEKRERIISLNKEIAVWQLSAIEAEGDCLDRIKQLAVFIRELEQGYSGNEELLQKSIESSKEEIIKLKEISKEVKSIE